MARVTGIGGVFFKARDPKALAAWYAQHLGIQLADWSAFTKGGGAALQWTDEIPAGTGQTTWMIEPEATSHFPAETQRAMINYRVDDLQALVGQLEAAGIATDGKVESFSYGHFAWLFDPEGNRVELWQPVAD